jgi:hypothetical protein
VTKLAALASDATETILSTKPLESPIYSAAKVYLTQNIRFEMEQTQNVGEANDQ